MTFTTDVIINKTYPATEYDATESGHTYFEDREIDGVMYRAQNATFDGTSWSQPGSGASYATTQNSDGSIGHYFMPASSMPWTTWVYGNGQRGVFNVRDFGAVGDGLADDRQWIQNANDAAVLEGGGYIYLPAGTYLISAAILLGSATEKNIPITMGGDGAEFTTLLAGDLINDGGNIIMVANAQYLSAKTDIVQWNIYIEKLGFNANAANNLPPPPPNSFHGPIFLKQVQNCSVTDCVVFNSSNHGILITGIGDSSKWPNFSPLNFQILRNHINLNYMSDVADTYPGKFPIRVEGAGIGIIQGNTIGDLCTYHTNDAIDFPGCSHVECNDNYVTMCGDGMGANAASDCIFANNRIVGAQGYGISTFSSGGVGGNGVPNVTITGNTIFGVNKTGIRVSCPPGGPAPTNFAVTNNVVIFQTAPSPSLGPYAIHIEASQGCVTGNTIDLGATANTGISIDSFQAYNPDGSTGNSNVTVTGNTINNGIDGSRGIVFSYGPNSVSTDCVITGNTVFGVTTPLSPDFAKIVNCVVRGNPEINPWGGSITPPMISTSPTPNIYPFDIWVTIAGGTVSDVLINGKSTGVKNGSVLLPPGIANTITVNYTGTAPTWSWLAY